MIDSDHCHKNNGNKFLTLDQLHFFQIVILLSNAVYYKSNISFHKKNH